MRTYDWVRESRCRCGLTGSGGGNGLTMSSIINVQYVKKRTAGFGAEGTGRGAAGGGGDAIVAEESESSQDGVVDLTAAG